MAAGQVVGDLIVNLVIGGEGHWKNFWNSLPFCLFVAAAATAWLRAPEGPVHQFTPVIVLLGLSFVASFMRLLGLDVRWPKRDSAQKPPASALALRACVFAVFLVCAVAGAVRADLLRRDGEVDVTGQVEVRPTAKSSEHTVTLSDVPDRSRLRLTMRVEDARPGDQSCTPETRLTLVLTGGDTRRFEGVRPMRPVDVPLGGSRTDITLTVTVHAPRGCDLDVSAAEAVLHE
ncbi:hypothetical protein GKQ77_21095 [Streptomyces sp. BG9H]|uniref:Uncharacterized protein n=1 Tax=Streptomyces anatolicus TaxID=2675858 RepID=A0ABS6YU28_9ACTN|nr:hypothetical protein [Streptomyces anatolicus]MBW5424031.1 hypothetical protein [Streptomyces anatolicus]